MHRLLVQKLSVQYGQHPAAQVLSELERAARKAAGEQRVNTAGG
jgi:hypothetical protein